MDLKAIVAQEFKQAKDYYTSNFEGLEREALNYFTCKLPGQIDKDIEEIFATVVSPDVANAVEHTLADIMPAFASEAPVVFIPHSKDDELQVQIETDFVNDIFLQQSNGFVKLTSAVKDALLRQIGVFEIETYEKVVVQYQTLENVTFDVVASILEESSPDNTIELTELNGQKEGFQTLDISQPVKAVLRQTQKQRHLHIDTFPPNELLCSEDTVDIDLDNSRFVARQRILRVSELIELGYPRDLVENLPAANNSMDLVNQPHQQTQAYNLSYESPHISNKQVRVAFCYMYIDADDDGIAERRRIVIAGNLESAPVLLEDTPCGYQPFAVGVPLIFPHRLRGISLFEKIKQVQLVKTKVLRQLLTAGEAAARGRVGVVGNQANIDDVKSSISGGVVRLTTPNGVVNIPNPPFPSDVANLLGIMDKERKESGGSAIDKTDESMLIGGDTAHGLERMMSAIEQLNSLMAKIIAETLLRQIYLKIHSNLRRNFKAPVDKKFNTEWTTVTPSTWPERTNVTIALGLTMGDRLRQAASYKLLLDEQMLMLEKGSILTTEQNIYALLIARANALMIPNGQSYYVDPRSPEGMMAAAARKQQQDQQQQLIEREKLMNLELLPRVESIKAAGLAQVQELRNAIEREKIVADTQSALADLSVKYSELGLKLTELNAKYDKEQVPGGLDTKRSSSV